MQIRSQDVGSRAVGEDSRGEPSVPVPSSNAARADGQADGQSAAAVHGRDEIHGIQYLRAIAAMGVLAFHLSEQFGGPFDLGAAGVDLFFVISSFIMWVTTADRPITPQRFALHRFIRVVPLYWLVTCVTALGILLKPQFFYGHILSSENFLGSLAFLPSVQRGVFHPVVLQGWTLCYEMMFYAIFALTLWLKPSRRLAVLTVIFVVMAVLHDAMPSGYLRLYTNPIILEFLMGILIGTLWTGRLRVPRWLAIALFVLGLLALLATQFLAMDMMRLLRWGLPSALLVAGIVLIEKGRASRPVNLIGFLGDASYSIYLWHGVLAAVLTAVLLRLHLPTALQPVVLFSGCLVLAALLNLIIEQPLVRLLRRRESVPR